MRHFESRFALSTLVGSISGFWVILRKFVCPPNFFLVGARPSYELRTSKSSSKPSLKCSHTQEGDTEHIPILKKIFNVAIERHPPKSVDFPLEAAICIKFVGHCKKEC